MINFNDETAAPLGIDTTTIVPRLAVSYDVLGNEKVRLDAAAYTKYRASPDKAERDAVFKAFFGRYGRTSYNARDVPFPAPGGLGPPVKI